MQAKYWNPYVGGVLLGVLLFVSMVLTSHGLGASGGYARITAAVEDVVAPGHVDRTPAVAELAGGGRNALDHWLVWAVAGTVLGGFLSGRLRGRVRLETFSGAGVSVRTRWVLAVVGGAIVGYAARIARGCTSGQGLSGGAVLAVGSFVFLFAVFAGGFGLAYFVRRLWQQQEA